MPFIGTSQMEKDISGMIALDYAGCTLHPKLAFQFAKHFFLKIYFIEKQTEPKIKNMLQHHSASTLKAMLCYALLPKT